MTRIIVGISGASGSIYGVRLLQKLAKLPEIETHAVLSRPGEKTLFYETALTIKDIKALATHWHSIDAIGAPIASGSYPIDAMVVAPCSVHTMSAIAAGIASNLLVRAADVTIKEQRPLILAVRESPLHLGHLRTMVSLTEMGAVIAPPLPAFYTKPETLDNLVDHSVNRILDLLGLSPDDAHRWDGV